MATVYRCFPPRAVLCAAIVCTTLQREVDVIQAIAETGAPASGRSAMACRLFDRRAMQGRQFAHGLIGSLAPDAESEPGRQKENAAAIASFCLAGMRH